MDAWFSKEGILVVESIIHGGPADKSGIRSGDQIFKIDPKGPEYFIQKGLKFRPDKFSPELAASVLMGEPGTKVTLIVCPYSGLDKLAGKNGEPGCRGAVKIMQLERAHVRAVPEGLSPAGALRHIAESRSF